MDDWLDSDRDRRSQAPDISEDGHADFHSARLSHDSDENHTGYAESAVVAKRKAQQKQDFDIAAKLQFGAETGAGTNGHTPSYQSDASVSSLTVPESEHSKKVCATIVDVAPESAGQMLISFTEFSDHIKTTACTQCGERFFESESTVTKIFQDWYNGESNLSSRVKCKTCYMTSCVGCSSATNSERSSVMFEDKSISWCCNNGRLLLIWILLCGFDVTYCETEVEGATKAEKVEHKPESPPRIAEKGKGTIRSAPSVKDSGIGYGGDPSSSSRDPDLDEFGSRSSEYADILRECKKKMKRMRDRAPGWEKSHRSQAPMDQQSMDKLGSTIFILLQHLLPSLERGHSFDVDPPAMIGEMLLESKLLDYSLELLSNDCLNDMFLRKAAYEALLEFVKVVSMHHATANTTVFLGKPKQPKLCNLLAQTYRRVEIPSSDAAPSIADGLCELSKTSDRRLKKDWYSTTVYSSDKGVYKTVFSRGKLAYPSDKLVHSPPKRGYMVDILITSGGKIKFVPDEPTDPSRVTTYTVGKTTYTAGDAIELLSLCRKISDSWVSLSAQMLDLGPEVLSAAANLELATVSEVADSQIFSSHAYGSEAQEQHCSAPGRLKRILAEINVLKTALPPGIFVRHGESRVDVMKFIIIGPEGSPYANGMWEFDMYCPAEYPKVPPQVLFKTTGDERQYMLNPNLYSNGKVCLSLLGTWAGEPWKPGQSTILQVLVSLQAMVFCEKPWYNEPGRERHHDDGFSEKRAEGYNREIRELTVRVGMLPWLEKTPKMWKEVVKQHFGTKADRILGTVIEWSKKSRPKRSGRKRCHGRCHCGIFSRGADYKALLGQLHKHLQEYGATVAVPDHGEEDTDSVWSMCGSDEDKETMGGGHMDGVNDIVHPSNFIGRGAHGGGNHFGGRGHAPSTVQGDSFAGSGHGRGRGSAELPADYAPGVYPGLDWGRGGRGDGGGRGRGVGDGVAPAFVSLFGPGRGGGGLGSRGGRGSSDT